jgi:hypothetical protein
MKIFSKFILGILLIGLLSGCEAVQSDTLQATPTVIPEATKVAPSAKKEITIDDLCSSQSAGKGELTKIYRVDLNYKNDDGSNIVTNFQSVKKHASFATNKGTTENDVIVIENVPPIEITRNFIDKVAYFQAFDKYGEEKKVGDIYTQSGKEYSDIIVTTEGNLDDYKYILVGGFDNSTGNSKYIFVIK